ncbi:MAG: hypothetical protein SOX56_02100 [[Pasteurella] mairii]|nr:hypothetical protein [[Pasteurella] mairii]
MHEYFSYFQSISGVSIAYLSNQTAGASIGSCLFIFSQKNHRSFHFPRFHRRSDLPFLGKFVVFELATQASFKFSVKEMVIKRREKVKQGCLFLVTFLLATQRKVTLKNHRTFPLK